MLIGTPGRVIDYFKQHVFDMRHAQAVVLDEADRMFDLGFIADIRFILRRLPKPEHRQSMLFSATLSQRVLELAYEHMNNPELVRIEPDRVTADKVRQLIYFPAMEEKVPLLIGLLRQFDARRTMVFVNTKRVAERLEGYLSRQRLRRAGPVGRRAAEETPAFHARVPQRRTAVLIATDVASRGLHIPDVSHVFNFDLPQDAPDYVHRIGRTARAGAEGDAISFGCEEYAVSLPDIEDYISHKIEVATVRPELLARDLKPPVYKEWDPEDGPRPVRRPGGGGGGRGGPRRGGGGGGRGGPRSSGGSGGGGRRRGGRSRRPVKWGLSPFARKWGLSPSTSRRRYPPTGDPRCSRRAPRVSQCRTPYTQRTPASPGGIQHPGIVVDEQAAGRIEAEVCDRRLPEPGMLLRMTKIVGSR